MFSELLSYPFIQRAVIGGIMVALLSSSVGVLAVLRRSSMVGDTVAHASLAGVALGLFLGIHPMLAAAFVAILVALSLPPLQKYSSLPADNLLGFILPFSMAWGVLLLAFIPGYQPELISFLFGSILSIAWIDVVIMAIVGLIAVIALLIWGHSLIFVSFDEEYARTSGVKVDWVNTLYHVVLALTIVVGIKLVGIVLLNALLIIPASTVRLFSRSLQEMFILTPIISMVTVVLGIGLSFWWNVPTGPIIAALSGGILLITLLVVRGWRLLIVPKD